MCTALFAVRTRTGIGFTTGGKELKGSGSWLGEAKVNIRRNATRGVRRTLTVRLLGPVSAYLQQ